MLGSLIAVKEFYAEQGYIGICRFASRQLTILHDQVVVVVAAATDLLHYAQQLTIIVIREIIF